MRTLLVMKRFVAK